MDIINKEISSRTAGAMLEKHGEWAFNTMSQVARGETPYLPLINGVGFGVLEEVDAEIDGELVTVAYVVEMFDPTWGKPSQYFKLEINRRFSLGRTDFSGMENRIFNAMLMYKCGVVSPERARNTPKMFESTRDLRASI